MKRPVYDCVFIFDADFFGNKICYLHKPAAVRMLNFSHSLHFWQPTVTKDNSLHFVKYTAHRKILHLKSTDISWFYIQGYYKINGHFQCCMKTKLLII
jgi:hypothetical protein